MKGGVLIKSNIKVKFNPNVLEKAINNAISKSDFSLKCPNCKNNFNFSGQFIGNNVICPNCNVKITLNDDKLKKNIKDIKNSLR